MNLLAVRAGTGALIRGHHEVRRRFDHAAACMEEAAVVTSCLAGLSVAVKVFFWDIGLSHWIGFDPARIVVWTVLSAGIARRHRFPAYLLLGDIAVRTVWHLVNGESPFLPAVALVAALTMRALIAGYDADEALEALERR